MKRKSVLKTAIVTVMKKHPVLCLLLLVSVIGSTLAALLPPLVLESFIDGLQEKSDVLFSGAVLYFASVLLESFTVLAKEGCIASFGQSATHALRSALSGKLSRLSAEYYVKSEPGRTASVFTSDVTAVETLFTSGVISMVSDFVTILGVLWMIFTRSKGLFGILLIAIPLLFWLTRVFQKKMLVLQKTNRQAVSESSAEIPETMENIRSIHVFHAEKWMQKRYAKSIEKGYQAGMKTAFFDSVYSPIMILSSTLIIALMMVLSVSGNHMRSWFGMNAGTAAALIAYVGKIFGPLAGIGMEIQNIQTASAGIARIQEFMNLPERKMPSKEILQRKGKDLPIMIEHVTFGYDPHVPVLKDFSLAVHKGEMVTLSGRTGCGKTTLFKLIQGLYEPQAGSILIEGREPSDVSESDRRKVIACVEQNFVMIQGNIRDQITLRNPQINDAMVKQALETVGLWERVSSFEKGLEEPCTSALFSRGQFQLLSIARAIVCDPQILLLDEITANLDSETERKVTDALQKASRSRTVLSISHRLPANGSSRIVNLEKV
jgi:ABC-type multidrug transport system fused ATPase/permease subunit